MSRDSTVNWRDAEGYLSSRGNCTPLVQTGRASVAMLRTQNAGMVLAKAKLFDDGRRDSQKSAKSLQTKPSRRTHSESPKNNASNASAIKTRSNSGKREDSDVGVRPYKENRHRLSPLQQGKTQVLSTILQENDLNVNVSPRTSSALCKTPHIKKPLNPSAKTPKSARSLMRKQGIDLKRTPMKAMSSLPLTTPKRQSPRNVLKNRHLSRRMS